MSSRKKSLSTAVNWSPVHLLLFDFKESPRFGESLYYDTLDEAKSKAERDTPIKILRDAELRANKDGQPRSGETIVPLKKDAILDFEEPAQKVSENHAKYEVRIQGNPIYLVEGVDFEFIK